MRKCVADGAANKYKLENTKMILYLYDDIDLRDTLLEEWFVEEIEKAEELDNATARTKRTQKHTRAYIKDALDNMSALENNCPVILPAFTFPHFSAYLTSQKKLQQHQLLMEMEEGKQHQWNT